LQLSSSGNMVKEAVVLPAPFGPGIRNRRFTQ
jgi:hypothetical protein